MRQTVIFAVFAALLLVSCSESSAPQKSAELPQSYLLPAHFPAPTYNLAGNPYSPAVFELGRSLFYDGILSRDSSISCGSCHIPSSAFTQHGHDLSHGIDDKLTLRNSLPIQNLAWQPLFFWDGGVADLDLFAVFPITAHNEMDETMESVLNKLRTDRRYTAMFERAFGTSTITTDRFLKALSQFQLLCVSSESAYDDWVVRGTPLPVAAERGRVLFDRHCAECHAGPLQTDNTFRNNGLPVGNAEDLGRELVTLRAEDRFTFRVPSLRNVALTGPYMHDGRFRNLRGVLEHYVSGVQQSATLDPALRADGKLGIPLSALEQADIIEFLHSLTDTSFTRKQYLAEPR